MAITSITAIQNNIDLVGLISVHNPLAIIIEVEYTTTVPDLLYVAETTYSNKIYSCIPYSDPLPGKRQFIFYCDEIIRGLMENFDDAVQADSTNVAQLNMTIDIEFKFYDPLAVTLEEGVNELFIYTNYCHATRQFGENPSLNELYNNDAESYIGIVGFPCYVYYYCIDTSSTLTVTVS